MWGVQSVHNSLSCTQKTGLWLYHKVCLDAIAELAKEKLRRFRKVIWFFFGFHLQITQLLSDPCCQRHAGIIDNFVNGSTCNPSKPAFSAHRKWSRNLTFGRAYLVNQLRLTQKCGPEHTSTWSWSKLNHRQQKLTREDQTCPWMFRKRSVRGGNLIGRLFVNTRTQQNSPSSSNMTWSMRANGLWAWSRVPHNRARVFTPQLLPCACQQPNGMAASSKTQRKRHWIQKFWEVPIKTRGPGALQFSSQTRKFQNISQKKDYLVDQRGEQLEQQPTVTQNTRNCPWIKFGKDKTAMHLLQSTR